MTRSVCGFLLLLLVTPFALAQSPANGSRAATTVTTERADAIVGAWAGKSLCTNVRPACHDEQALYRITPIAGDSAHVQMSMAKVVDGKEEVMGVSLYEVDYAKRTLSWELTRGELHVLWSFTWKGRRMTGTLRQLPGGEVIRNITLQKQ